MKPHPPRRKAALWICLPLCAALASCKNGTANTNDNASAGDPSGRAKPATADFQVHSALAQAVSGTNADNTARNAPDQTNSALTATDQSNSSSDIQITAKIRKAIVSGTNDFSFMAKNIKIITRSGAVTLRGPVENEKEKTDIDVLARGIAGQTNVTDQLDVKVSE